MKTIEGDLLAIERGVVLHQVNTQGVTGGLAGALRRKRPEAFRGYAALCARAANSTAGPSSLLGCFSCGSTNRGALWVCHIFGQLNPGPNTDMEAVERALDSFASETLPGEHAWSGLPIYAPYRMGCGLGGGDWTSYSAMLEKHLPDIAIVRKPGYDQ